MRCWVGASPAQQRRVLPDHGAEILDREGAPGAAFDVPLLSAIVGAD